AMQTHGAKVAAKRRRHDRLFLVCAVFMIFEYLLMDLIELLFLVGSLVLVFKINIERNRADLAPFSRMIKTH
ncbi:hypothetical protein OAH76_03265, partial [Verrucomicrobia bacterium]|nr:hypothetical protein [bacterium]MDB4803862.1 hypothetical protein [Verrucomicrobiota bacterium]